MLYKALTVAAVATAVAAQGRPENTSICDYYTTALLTNNTAANQKAVLTLVVNTAVIGNYKDGNKTVVNGILNNGTVNGTEVSLLKYFDGSIASSNRGAGGVAINFLDGGGAAPLMKDMPAEDDSSNQYMLLTHLYEYFGALLGCSHMGEDGYSAYDGQASMYEVHKFMALDNAETQYFISQVAASAESFGVAMEDIAVVGTALNGLFAAKCAPETMAVTDSPQLQSICIADDCPTAANATCSSYAAVMEPAAANSSNTPSGTATPSSSGSPTTSPTGSMSPTASPGAASAVGMSFAAVAAGLFAALL